MLRTRTRARWRRIAPRWGRPDDNRAAGAPESAPYPSNASPRRDSRAWRATTPIGHRPRDPPANAGRHAPTQKSSIVFFARVAFHQLSGLFAPPGGQVQTEQRVAYPLIAAGIQSDDCRRDSVRACARKRRWIHRVCPTRSTARPDPASGACKAAWTAGPEMLPGALPGTLTPGSAPPSRPLHA